MRQRKEINVQIGANIQTLREQAGYTQDELSELIGITPNHLSAIERGVSGVSLESLRKLCHILGVCSDRIIFGPTSDNAERVIADKIASIDIKYQRPVRKILSAVLEITTMREDDAPT